MSKVLIVTSSLRGGSNSDILAQKAAEGARAAGHEVELVSLRGKKLGFCIGCLSCQRTHKCVLQDDVAELREKVKKAETLLFVSPIYYYEMSGQLKTFLDRMNPLYGDEYDFRNVYLLTVAADDAEETPNRALNGLGGWVECFDKAELCGSFFAGGINSPKEAATRPDVLEKAYAFGKWMK